MIVHDQQLHAKSCAGPIGRGKSLEGIKTKAGVFRFDRRHTLAPPPPYPGGFGRAIKASLYADRAGRTPFDPPPLY